MNFPSEYEAFKAYADTYPDATLLLVDTYDTLKSGVPNAIRVFKELKEKGHKPVGIRLDSGDLAYLTKQARKMLDEAGFPDTIICASGDMDEYSVTSLKGQGAKINSWGIGTKLITSADMPALGGVYKLSAVFDDDGNEIPKIKISDNSAKITNPGFKGIYRIFDKATGKAEADLIHLRSENIDFSKPITLFHPIETWKKTTYTDYTVCQLTTKVIENGKLVKPLPTLPEIVENAKKSLSGFWDEYRRLDKPHLYKVDLSDELYELKKNMLKSIREN
jgi:nicotinate phosphoribosyltransferase